MRADGVAFAALLAALMASAALAGCSRDEPPAAPAVARTAPPPVLPPAPKPPPAFLRDHYAQLADCADDWGAAHKCTPAPAALEAAGVRFLGPIYAKGYREETQAQLRREAVEQGYAPQASGEPGNRARASVEVRP
jgi:hypothetical protein